MESRNSVRVPLRIEIQNQSPCHHRFVWLTAIPHFFPDTCLSFPASSILPLYSSPLHSISPKSSPPHRLLREPYPPLSSVIKMQRRDVIAAPKQGYLWGSTVKGEKEGALVLAYGSACPRRDTLWTDRSLQGAISHNVASILTTKSRSSLLNGAFICWRPPPTNPSQSLTFLNMNPLWTSLNTLGW